jgi:hypothetical protein
MQGQIQYLQITITIKHINMQLKSIELGKVKDVIGATDLTAYLVSVNTKKR